MPVDWPIHKSPLGFYDGVGMSDRWDDDTARRN